MTTRRMLNFDDDDDDDYDGNDDEDGGDDDIVKSILAVSVKLSVNFLPRNNFKMSHSYLKIAPSEMTGGLILLQQHIWWNYYELRASG